MFFFFAKFHKNEKIQEDVFVDCYKEFFEEFGIWSKSMSNVCMHYA